MSEQTDKLIELLTPYGLSDEEAKVYLKLLENGAATALQLSRKLGIGRTKVYRILDKLIAKELVIQQSLESGFKFLACEPGKLELLLNRKAGELNALRQALPGLVDKLDRRMSQGIPGSKVLYYHGQHGLSQVNWNLLKAEKEFCSYETSMAAYLPHDEAEELRMELVKEKIMSRNLYNLKHISRFTNISEAVTKWWQVRYIDPQEFKIQADVFIYNDVYTMCHYLGGGEIFCVEIYNEHLANMQKQLFEYIWVRAKEMKILNDRGEAVARS